MEFIAVGINHKNTPIEIREKLFLNMTQQELLLSELKSNPAVIEACVLSTCHRVEIYAYVVDIGTDLNTLIEPIFRIKSMPSASGWDRYFYRYFGQEAIRHLFEVASGLDSLVLGEDQILGQVKNAFDCAKRFGMFDRRFNILSNLAVRAGKKARQETDINFGGTSISWAAIAKAEEILGDLQGRSVLVIGAGKMSEIAVGHIQNKKFKKCYLMNRTPDHAKNIAQKFGGDVVSFCDLKEVLTRVDLCICSASAPHYLLEKDVVERVMPVRAHKPLLFIDISMPRNIDPQIKGIDQVLLYQIDDLQEVVSSNMKVRENAIKSVKAIIDAKIDEFEQKLKKLPQPADELPSSATGLSDHIA